MRFPKGKTRAYLTSDIPLSALKEYDVGYIDGYVHGADNSPYAVFVRDGDGVVEFVSIRQLRAIFDE